MSKHDIYIQNEEKAAMQYVVLRRRKHLDIFWNIWETLGLRTETEEKENMYVNNCRWTAIYTNEASALINCLEAVGISCKVIDHEAGLGYSLDKFLELCDDLQGRKFENE